MVSTSAFESHASGKLVNRHGDKKQACRWDRLFSSILPNASAIVQPQPGRNLFIGPREFVSFSAEAGGGEMK
jgi:hypothetical protein